MDSSSRILKDTSNIEIPTTPHRKRARDVSSQLLTPSSSSPKKHRLESSITSSREGVKKLVFSTPPSTPTKPKKTSVYSSAKALFQRGGSLTNGLDISHLTGREKEGNSLNEFFLSNIKNKTCGSLYVSGPPGTGKSAQINVSVNYFKSAYGNSKQLDKQDIVKIEGSRVKFININCMAINSPEHIFHEVYSRAVGTLSISMLRKKTSDDFYELLQSNSELDSIVVVLDEMDYLITRDQQILFELFNCASTKSQQYRTKLVLVGISNALDLTDKFLPRLKRNGLSPESVQFLPYTADQIRQVITCKLNSLKYSTGDLKETPGNMNGVFPLFHPAAIQFCCRKAASITGDLRKAFDICYKSIDLLEQGLVQKGEDLNKYNIDNCPKVLISHVAKICSSSFGDNSLTRLTNLNLLQKAVLCCLVNYQAKNMSSTDDLNVNSFFDFYVKHSANNVDKLLGVLKKGEFLEILSALESASIISLSDKKELRRSNKNVFNVDIGNKGIQSTVAFEDLVKAIGDIGVLKRILHGN
ncbi:cell cycle control protein [Scheffersomyces xylosifermentans]|uniref:cell cycle control protein n=1 Tax=Scheffersomyces xylosifermentans TaxID=1304137 RepID=UPI00315DC5AA